MIRRTSVAAAIAAGIIVVPGSARAQRPLRTWCNSPTHDYCISILSYSSTYSLANEAGTEVDWFGVSEVRGFGTALAQGSGFEVDPLGVGFEVQGGYFGDGYYMDYLEGGTFTQPGQTLRYAEATNIPTPVRESTVDDFAYVAFWDQNRGIYTDCWTSQKWKSRLDRWGSSTPLCYRVPEPRTAALLIPGLAILGLEVRRRRSIGRAA